MSQHGSLFLGLNLPLIGFVNNDVMHGPHTKHVLFGRLGFVYIASDCLSFGEYMLVDWICLPVSNRSAPEHPIGGADNFSHHASMWFVPRLLGSRSR